MIRERIFQNGTHSWFIFGHDPEKPASLSDTNQIVICSRDDAVLIDPGGLEIFPSALAAITETVPSEAIRHIVLTHAEPDACSSTPLWKQVCQGIEGIHAPETGVKSFNHLDTSLSLKPIPDKGTEISVGDITLSIIPSHHLPSAAAFCVYDPQARILYSGDLGSIEAPDSDYFVDDFEQHIEALSEWHERRLVSAQARDDWLALIKELDVEMIIPHHGPAYRGRNTGLFLDWLAQLSLGSTPQQVSTKDDSDPLLGEDDDPLLGEEIEEPSINPLVSDEILNKIDMSDAPTQGADPHMLVEEFDTTDTLILTNPIDAIELADEPTSSHDASASGKGDVDNNHVDADFAALLGEEIEEVYISDGTADTDKQYRLVTRSDFDGLVCAVLFEEMGMIDDILFVHPNDMQEGRVEITASDIITNLPYVPGCHLAFDHHESEITRLGQHFANHIIIGSAPSAARVVYEYYGAKDNFPNVAEDLIEAVDKGDSAQYSIEEVLNPDGWPLLNFIMDSRTGLGRFRGFRIPNYELMMELIDACREHPIEDILQLPDVKERVDLYFEQSALYTEQAKRCATVHDNVVVLNLLEEDTVYVGNRFLIYALFPQCNVSIHEMWGRDRQNVVFACGKSIFDRTSQTDIGDLMLKYGGGGHKAAGTCQSETVIADTVKQALIKQMNEDG